MGGNGIARKSYSAFRDPDCSSDERDDRSPEAGTRTNSPHAATRSDLVRFKSCGRDAVSTTRGSCKVFISPEDSRVAGLIRPGCRVRLTAYESAVGQKSAKS